MASGDDYLFNMSKYLLELSLVQYRMNQYSASEIAAGALYLSMKMLKRPTGWNERLSHHTQFVESDIRSIAREHFKNLQDAQMSSLQAVRKKFSLPKYNEVAKFKCDVQRRKEDSTTASSMQEE